MAGCAHRRGTHARMGQGGEDGPRELSLDGRAGAERTGKEPRERRPVVSVDGAVDEGDDLREGQGRR